MNSVSYSALVANLERNLSVPRFQGGESNFECAIAYQECGWWIVPVSAGTKNPGSILGKSWPTQSSNNPQDAITWFKNNPEIGIALHTGPSKALVFDVDHSDRLPSVLKSLLTSSKAPFQSTRPDAARGHYVFSLPLGKEFSCSTAGLGGGWGEIRAGNTVIMAYPSRHKNHSDGARYKWETYGPTPILPQEIELKLRLKSRNSAELGAVQNLGDEELQALFERFTGSSAPELLSIRVEQSLSEFRRGSRHDALKFFLLCGFKESRAGLYSALDMANAALNLFLEFKPREEWSSPTEFWDLVRWTASATSSLTDGDLELARQAGLALASPGVRAWLEVMSNDK